MKIKEFVNEGILGSALRGLGNLAHGAVRGATGALKNTPDRISATTKLAADPYKMKALPGTFAAKPKPGQPGEPAPQPTKQPTSIPGFAVIDQDPMVVRYQGKDYALNNEGEWYPMSAKGARPPLVKDTNPALEKMLDKVAGF